MQHGVENHKIKDKILELRKNPRIASFMAAEFSAGNKRHLDKNTNIKTGSTELYLAHFMGARGATYQRGLSVAGPCEPPDNVGLPRGPARSAGRHRKGAVRSSCCGSVQLQQYS